MWSDTKLVLWTRSGLEGFSLGGTAREFTYSPEGAEPNAPAPYLVSVSPFGDDLVLGTSTGVRVLGTESGRVVAGLDPLPCESEPSSPPALLDGERLAVAFDQYVYVLDLSGQ